MFQQKLGVLSLLMCCLYVSRATPAIGQVWKHKRHSAGHLKAFGSHWENHLEKSKDHWSHVSKTIKKGHQKWNEHWRGVWKKHHKPIAPQPGPLLVAPGHGSLAPNWTTPNWAALQVQPQVGLLDPKWLQDKMMGMEYPFFKGTLVFPTEAPNFKLPPIWQSELDFPDPDRRLGPVDEGGWNPGNPGSAPPQLNGQDVTLIPPGDSKFGGPSGNGQWRPNPYSQPPEELGEPLPAQVMPRRPNEPPQFDVRPGRRRPPVEGGVKRSGDSQELTFPPLPDLLTPPKNERSEPGNADPPVGKTSAKQASWRPIIHAQSTAWKVGKVWSELPDGFQSTTIRGTQYFRKNDTYLLPVKVGETTTYVVVEPPSSSGG